MAGIIAFCITFAISTLITPAVIAIARKYKLVDDPQKRYHPAHVHVGIIPRAGGLSLFVSIAIGIILFLGFTKITVGLLFAGLLLTVVGLIDDRKDVSPYIRLGTNTLAALLIIGAGV